MSNSTLRISIADSNINQSNPLPSSDTVRPRVCVVIPVHGIDEAMPFAANFLTMIFFMLLICRLKLFTVLLSLQYSALFSFNLKLAFQNKSGSSSETDDV